MMNDATRYFIAQHLLDDVHTLALKKMPDTVDAILALQQIQARQILRKKLPEWSANMELLFPANLSLQQASSELTAHYKSTLIEGSTLVDLTGGLGVDCFYLSQRMKQTYYVEQQETLCQIARHNFEQLKANISVEHNSAELFLEQMTPVDTIFVDPARRDLAGHKMVSIADCTPNLILLQNILCQKGRQVLIKLSPMLDITTALRELQHIEQLHVLSVDNECKELLLLMNPQFEGQTEIICANLQHQGSIQKSTGYTLENEKQATISFTSELGNYLYEPNSSLLKAGLFKSVALRYHLEKLHPSSHLYTSNAYLPDFEGRIFRIEQQLCFSKKELRLIKQSTSKANITVRNFPLSVQALRKELSIAEGGNQFIFATTLANRQHILLLCTKASNLIND